MEGSSAVEQETVNLPVAGSIPALPGLITFILLFLTSCTATPVRECYDYPDAICCWWAEIGMYYCSPKGFIYE